MRTRDERFQLMLAHRAAAKALEASLKDEAAEEYELHRTRVTWDLVGGGSVMASLVHDATRVVDPEAFMEWLAVAYPHQVRRVTRLEVINQDWVSKVLLPSLVPLALAEDDPEPAQAKPGDRLTTIDPAESSGAVVPGVRWCKGGGLSSVSVKTDKAAEARMNLAAAAYVEGVGAMPGLESGDRS